MFLWRDSGCLHAMRHTMYFQFSVLSFSSTWKTKWAKKIARRNFFSSLYYTAQPLSSKALPWNTLVWVVLKLHIFDGNMYTWELIVRDTKIERNIFYYVSWLWMCVCVCMCFFMNTRSATVYLSIPMIGTQWFADLLRVVQTSNSSKHKYNSTKIDAPFHMRILHAGCWEDFLNGER